MLPKHFSILRLLYMNTKLLDKMNSDEEYVFDVLEDILHTKSKNKRFRVPRRILLFSQNYKLQIDLDWNLLLLRKCKSGNTKSATWRYANNYEINLALPCRPTRGCFPPASDNMFELTKLLGHALILLDVCPYFVC